ncbi:MAG: methionine aminotransferase [Bacteroidia bacterium]|nr:methionine aminotransferase [Bacteroidia bacterium]
MESSISITSKLPLVGTTIFTTMSALAQRHQAINLSQGFPDFPPDPILVEYLNQASAAGHHQYAPMPGLLLLREQVARRTEALHRASYDPDSEITITCGATEALFGAFQAFVHPGDEVVLFSPAYDSYEPGIRLAGGIPVFVPLTFPDYQIDWEAVGKAISPKTRGIVINSPHNPSGAIITASDVEKLGQLAEAHDLWVISDEVYDHMVFDGYGQLSLAGDSKLSPRTMVISSFGKTLHTTGWKVGYCLAPEKMMAEFRKVHQFLTFSVATPFQYAIASYLQHQAGEMDDLPRFYQRKRDLFLSLTSGSSLKPLHSSGTYFQLMDFSEVRPGSDLEMSTWLTQVVGVACIPVSVFYPDGTDHQVIRFCFAKQDETLVRAAERLRIL